MRPGERLMRDSIGLEGLESAVVVVAAVVAVVDVVAVRLGMQINSPHAFRTAR